MITKKEKTSPKNSLIASIRRYDDISFCISQVNKYTSNIQQEKDVYGAVIIMQAALGTLNYDFKFKDTLGAEAFVEAMLNLLSVLANELSQLHQTIENALINGENTNTSCIVFENTTKLYQYPLHQAKNLTLVELLLQYGANQNLRGGYLQQLPSSRSANLKFRELTPLEIAYDSEQYFKALLLASHASTSLNKETIQSALIFMTNDVIRLKYNEQVHYDSMSNPEEAKRIEEHRKPILFNYFSKKEIIEALADKTNTQTLLKLFNDLKDAITLSIQNNHYSSYVHRDQWILQLDLLVNIRVKFIKQTLLTTWLLLKSIDSQPGKNSSLLPQDILVIITSQLNTLLSEKLTLPRLNTSLFKTLYSILISFDSKNATYKPLEINEEDNLADYAAPILQNMIEIKDRPLFDAWCLSIKFHNDFSKESLATELRKCIGRCGYLPKEKFDQDWNSITQTIDDELTSWGQSKATNENSVAKVTI